MTCGVAATSISVFLISSFRRVLYVVCFLLLQTPANYPKESIQQSISVIIKQVHFCRINHNNTSF
jgi:hypothetical protein